MTGDGFDAIVGAETWERPLESHEAVHLYGSMMLLTAMLGAWDAEEAALAADPDFQAFRDQSPAEVAYSMDRQAEVLRQVDRMGEIARRWAVVLSDWARAKVGPMYLYVLVPCCQTLVPVVLGDGGPARFFDPELDTLPVRP